MIIPKPLFTGARVALIAPSGPVPEGRLEPAVASVQALGLEPVVFPSCTMRHGYLAGYDRERAADFNNAFSDASIHGVICIRGGYGAQRLMGEGPLGAEVSEHVGSLGRRRRPPRPAWPPDAGAGVRLALGRGTPPVPHHRRGPGNTRRVAQQRRLVGQ